MSLPQYTPYGTGDEQSYNPQRSLEIFYYDLPIEHRISMPYDLRDHFETTNPDYNDQFVFFMLAFFDDHVEKTEMQRIELGFSALLSLLDRNYAIWINKYSIQRIRQELLLLLKEKSVEECMAIFESLVPDNIKRIRLFASLQLMGVIDSSEQAHRIKGLGF